MVLLIRHDDISTQHIYGAASSKKALTPFGGGCDLIHVIHVALTFALRAHQFLRNSPWLVLRLMPGADTIGPVQNVLPEGQRPFGYVRSDGIWVVIPPQPKLTSAPPT
jgi:hypothetical protein